MTTAQRPVLAPGEEDRRERCAACCVLFGIVVLSLLLNLTNIGFGLPYVYGRNVEGRIVELAVRAFVTGDLNPHVSIYPHLQLYLLLIAFLPWYAWGRLSGIFASRADLLTAFQTDPTPLYMIARGVTALFGTACVLMVYVVARRLFGKKVALTAAFLMAVFPLLVTNAHMVTPDVIMTFFILLSFYFALRIAESGGFRDYILGGGALGLAFTAKYPAAIAGVFLLVAHGIARRRERGPRRADGGWERPAALTIIVGGAALVLLGFLLDLSPLAGRIAHRFPGRGGDGVAVIRGLIVLAGAAAIALPFRFRRAGTPVHRHRLLLAGLASIGLFILVGSPYLLIDFSSTLNSILYHAATESRPFWGSEDTPVGWIYYLILLQEGAGFSVVILAIAGMLLLLFRHRSGDLLFLSFPVVYYLFMGSFETKFPRYVIPILPWLAISAASLIDRLEAPGGRRTIRHLGHFVLVMIWLLALSPLVDSVRWVRLRGRTDTRTLAKEWIERNIPPGSRIATEGLGPPLSEDDYQLFVFFRGSLGPIGDPWAHYHLGEAGDVNVLFENDIEYAVVNSNAYGNYRRVPHLYPDEYTFYIDLNSEGRLLQDFRPGEHPGPEIKIYSLKPGERFPRAQDVPGTGAGPDEAPGAGTGTEAPSRFDND
jgi:hypothetical protein